MTGLKNFRTEQGGVAIRMAAALCLTLLVLGACLHRDAGPRPLADRLTVFAKADLLVLFWLAATIGNVARLRFFSPKDIAGSASSTASAEVGRANALLQNTLEQVALAIPTHLILALLVTSSAPLIIALAALFTVGRLLFWSAYARGAQARAFGFALTLYPSLVGLVIGVAAVVRSFM